MPTKNQQLSMAARSGDQSACERLLSEGADINTQEAISLVAPNDGANDLVDKQLTPLMWALAGNHLGVFRYLLNRRASVAVCADDNWTAAHYAYYFSHSLKEDATMALSLLRRAGANMLAENAEGKKPFQVQQLNLRHVVTNYLAHDLIEGTRERAFEVCPELVKRSGSGLLDDVTIPDNWFSELVKVLRPTFNIRKFASTIAGAALFSITECPSDLSAYKASYLVNWTAEKVYYVNKSDEIADVTITDFAAFRSAILPLACEGLAVTMLTEEQVTSFIRGNGGHVYEVSVANDTLRRSVDALQAALIVIYARLAGKLDDKLGVVEAGERESILVKMIDEANLHCVTGFSGRAQGIVAGFAQPQNFSELLATFRKNIVEKVANIASADVHCKNRFYTVASPVFGLSALESGDSSKGDVPDEDKMRRLISGFQETMRLYPLMEGLVVELQSALVLNGYIGKKTEGESYAIGEYALIKSRLEALLFDGEEQEMTDILSVDEETYLINDVNWPFIRQTLQQKLIGEQGVLTGTFNDPGVTVLILAKADEKEAEASALRLSAEAVREEADLLERADNLEATARSLRDLPPFLVRNEHDVCDFFRCNSLSMDVVTCYLEACSTKALITPSFSSKLAAVVCQKGNTSTWENLIERPEIEIDKAISVERSVSETSVTRYKDFFNLWQFLSLAVQTPNLGGGGGGGGPKPWQMPWVDYYWRQARTPLMFAMTSPDYITMVSKVLSLGASVSSANSKGWTPMHEAAYLSGLYPERAMTIFYALLEKGASVNIKATGDLYPSDVARNGALRKTLLRRELIPIIAARDQSEWDRVMKKAEGVLKRFSDFELSMDVGDLKALFEGCIKSSDNIFMLPQADEKWLLWLTDELKKHADSLNDTLDFKLQYSMASVENRHQMILSLANDTDADGLMACRDEQRLKCFGVLKVSAQSVFERLIADEDIQEDVSQIRNVLEWDDFIVASIESLEVEDAEGSKLKNIMGTSSEAVKRWLSAELRSIVQHICAAFAPALEDEVSTPFFEHGASGDETREPIAVPA